MAIQLRERQRYLAALRRGRSCEAREAALDHHLLGRAREDPSAAATSAGVFGKPPSAVARAGIAPVAGMRFGDPAVDADAVRPEGADQRGVQGDVGASH
jgi:hypothetical protein